MTLPTLRERLENVTEGMRECANDTLAQCKEIRAMNSYGAGHADGRIAALDELAPVIAALIDAAEALEAFRSWHVAYKDSPNDNANKALAQLEKLAGGSDE